MSAGRIDTTSLEYVIAQFRHELGVQVCSEEATALALNSNALVAETAAAESDAPSDREDHTARTFKSARASATPRPTAGREFRRAAGPPPLPTRARRHGARVGYPRFNPDERYDADAPTLRSCSHEPPIAATPRRRIRSALVADPSGRFRRGDSTDSHILTNGTAAATRPEVPWLVNAGATGALNRVQEPTERAATPATAENIVRSTVPTIAPIGSAREPSGTVARAVALTLSGAFLALAVSVAADPLVNPLITIWSRLAALF